jgi:hypothetical protein
MFLRSILLTRFASWLTWDNIFSSLNMHHYADFRILMIVHTHWFVLQKDLLVWYIISLLPGMWCNYYITSFKYTIFLWRFYSRMIPMWVSCSRNDMGCNLCICTFSKIRSCAGTPREEETSKKNGEQSIDLMFHEKFKYCYWNFIGLQFRKFWIFQF